jgi:acetyltransferase-like isoleucine patch superfamily enzyme
MMTPVMAGAALPYVMITYPKGREVVTYEKGTAYTPEMHYVLIETNGWEAAGALMQLGFKAFEDYYDKSSPFMWGLPIDWKYGDAMIGRCTFYNSVEFEFAARLFFERVGRFTSINEMAYFQHNHPMNMIGTGRFQQLFSFEKQGRYFQKIKEDPHLQNPGEKIVIGNDVWIGANTFINTSRCHVIGDGAIIAAGAVVNEDVPPYAIVAGVPGKVKKYRYTPEQIDILLRVRWWDWDDETIDRNAELLMEPEKFFEAFK